MQMPTRGTATSDGRETNRTSSRPELVCFPDGDSVTAESAVVSGSGIHVTWTDPGGWAVIVHFQKGDGLRYNYKLERAAAYMVIDKARWSPGRAWNLAKSFKKSSSPKQLELFEHKEVV